MTEFGKMQELPLWKDKEFEEVNRDELQARNIKRAEEQEKKTQRLSKVEEKPIVCISPSKPTLPKLCPWINPAEKPC